MRRGGMPRPQRPLLFSLATLCRGAERARRLQKPTSLPTSPQTTTPSQESKEVGKLRSFPRPPSALAGQVQLALLLCVIPVRGRLPVGDGHLIQHQTDDV